MRFFNDYSDSVLRLGIILRHPVPCILGIIYADLKEKKFFCEIIYEKRKYEIGYKKARKAVFTDFSSRESVRTQFRKIKVLRN